MAIIDKFEVTVRSDHKPLQEYELPQGDEAGRNHHAAAPEGSMQIMKYVKAFPKAKYEIKCHVAQSFDLESPRCSASESTLMASTLFQLMQKGENTIGTENIR